MATYHLHACATKSQGNLAMLAVFLRPWSPLPVRPNCSLVQFKISLPWQAAIRQVTKTRRSLPRARGWRNRSARPRVGRLASGHANRTLVRSVAQPGHCRGSWRLHSRQGVAAYKVVHRLIVLFLLFLVVLVLQAIRLMIPPSEARRPRAVAVRLDDWLDEYFQTSTSACGSEPLKSTTMMLCNMTKWVWV